MSEQFFPTAGPQTQQVENGKVRPVPQPGPGEVLIRVAAAGVNRPDVLQRMGYYPPPPGASDLPGLEIAGTIVAVGPGGDPEQLGQAVCALVAGGGYAEYCVAPAGTCLTVPEVLRMTEAAAMPETLFTVWTNLFERGFAAEGDTVLVHGGTSGIGTMAIRLGALFGLEVIVTCGSDEKCAAAIELGAAHAINYRTSDFVDAVQRWTEGKGVAVVLDMVGGDYVPRNLACLADDGRHVSNRLPARAGRGNLARRGDAQAADPDRLLPPTPRPGLQDHGARRDPRNRLALCRGQPAEAGDGRELPAGTGGRGACPNGGG